MTSLLYGVFILFSPDIVWGYSYGAPELACDYMTPAHPGAPQTSVAPYVLTLSNTTYVPNRTLTGIIIIASHRMVSIPYIFIILL